MISQNIRYLLWNRGAWRLLKNTYTLFLTPCIRCTNHSDDSCGLIDVNPHFIPSLLPMIQNIDLLWRHRYNCWPPAIVTSQWPIVPALFLWTLSQRELMLRVGKRHVRAKFFRISGAVKWLASDVMINWPRATCTARNHGNNGFDHNVAAGYHETSRLNWSRATHDANNGFDHTAQVVST